MSRLMDVEEYRVRVEHDGTMAEGIVWVRGTREWELGGEKLPTVVADASETNAANIPAFYHRLTDKLSDAGMTLRSCGSCVNFRRLPESPNTAEGWRGLCNYTAPEAFASGVGPGFVALLAPDCHHYALRDGEAPLIEILPDTAPAPAQLPDPERTLPIRAPESPKGLLGTLKRLISPKKAEPTLLPTGVIERPGGQPCPSCGTRMTNRASIANATVEGDERIFSVWRCPHCNGNYLDDWFEAYVGSKARDAERLYVIPPSEADVGVQKVSACPRPDVKGCTCVSNQWFGSWGDRLKQVGRRIQHRESVVDL